MTGLMPELTAGRRDGSMTPRPKTIELRGLKFLLPAEPPAEVDIEAFLGELDEDPDGFKATLGFLHMFLGPDGFKRLMDGVRAEVVLPTDLPGFVTTIYVLYVEGAA